MNYVLRYLLEIFGTGICSSTINSLYPSFPFSSFLNLAGVGTKNESFDVTIRVSVVQYAR